VRQHLSVPQVVGLSIPGLIHAEGNPAADIVGVVGNVLKDGNDHQPEPELYVVHGSYGVRIGNGMNFVIRTRGNPTAIAADVRGLMRQIDRESIVVRTEPLTVDVATSLDTPRFAASVVGGFALVAMILAAIGLYGVLSYSVSQRLRELGIRAALGAGRGNLVGLVVREALAVTVAGVVLGVLGAGLFTRMMQQLLFGVTSLDAVAFGVAPVMLVTAAMAACIGPAWRAATSDPVITLRS
jgi:putative ABC transport system permease protein